MPTLVTSLGRTGTAWLADCLDWPHEPKGNPERMVSPAHLHRIALRSWIPPEDLEVVVITRKPEDQLLSIINRWSALGNARERGKTWKEFFPRYLSALDRLVAKGAKLMRYENLTHCGICLRIQLQNAGLPQPIGFSTRRVNAFPKKIATLPLGMMPFAHQLREAYDRWHALDTRSDSADESSTTTTSSPPRSQPCELTEPDSSKSS